MCEKSTVQQRIGDWVTVLGILISAVSMCVKSADRELWAQKWLAPRYLRAMNAYELLKSEKSIGPTDPGFAEVLEVVHIKIPRFKEDLSNVRFKFGFIVTSPIPQSLTGYGITAVIAGFVRPDGTGDSQQTNDWEPVIEKVFLKDRLKFFEVLTGWMGIGIAFSGVVLSKRFFTWGNLKTIRLGKPWFM